MRVGPLGCLGLLGAGTVGWAIGRAPDWLDGVRRDVVAAEARPAAVLLARADAPPGVAAVAALAPVATLPPPPPDRLPAPQPGARALARSARRPAADALLAAATAQSGDGDGEVLAAFRLAGTAQPYGLSLDPPSPAVARLAASGPRTGFQLATAAYADLGRGDRRAAADEFAAALAADPQADNAALWARELRNLRKRWSSEAYLVMRDGGTVGLGASPVLGGGQAGRTIAYTPMPLSPRPVYAVLRTTASGGEGFQTGSQTDSEQLAAGLRWQATSRASLSVERLIALADTGRNAWTVRAAGGAERRAGALVGEVYGEAGVIYNRRADFVAAVQARLIRPISVAALRFEPGVGLWSGIQRTRTTVDRVDLGPTLSIVSDAFHVRAVVDYRIRALGNAAPGSGPAITVVRSF